MFCSVQIQPGAIAQSEACPIGMQLEEVLEKENINTAS